MELVILAVILGGLSVISLVTAVMGPHAGLPDRASLRRLGLRVTRQDLEPGPSTVPYVRIVGSDRAESFRSFVRSVRDR